MGCGASIATLSLSNDAANMEARQQQNMTLHKPAPAETGAGRRKPVAPALETNHPVEQVVNHVHLVTESLSFCLPTQAEVDDAEADSTGWELTFQYDAEKPGTGTIYFGGAVALPPTPHCELRPPSAAELANVLQERALSGEEPRSWHFQPGGSQICPPAAVGHLQRLAATRFAEEELSEHWSMVCTVVIHLECSDNEAKVDGEKVQSQTTIVMIELPAPAAQGGKLVTLPRLRLVTQKLFVRGQVYDMVEVFGLDSCLLHQCVPPLPPQSPAAAAAAPDGDAARQGGATNTSDGARSGVANTLSPPPLSPPSSPKDDETRTDDRLAKLGVTHSGSCCVVCLFEPKDCFLLPCRHLCVCAGCAHGILRTTKVANKHRRRDGGMAKPTPCPICRQGIQSVVQLPIRPI